jgi:hypothetical protein
MRPFHDSRSLALRAACPALLLCACSGSTSAANDMSFEAKEPLWTAPCGAGAMNLELRTAPTQPLTVGLDGVEVTLTDAQGKPIEGALITLVPWMPLMGHGADVTPVPHAMGKGRYVLTNVNLFMPGEWQLRFQITAGTTSCDATPTFNVP